MGELGQEHNWVPKEKPFPPHSHHGANTDWIAGMALWLGEHS